MKYTRIPRSVLSNTSRLAHLVATYDQLVELFGEPDLDPCDKSQFEWSAKSDYGSICIWDYKYEGDARENKKWSVWYSCPEAWEKLVSSVEVLENVEQEPEIPTVTEHEKHMLALICKRSSVIPSLEKNYIHEINSLAPWIPVVAKELVEHFLLDTGCDLRDMVRLTQAGWAICAQEQIGDYEYAQEMVERLEGIRE